MKEEEASGSLRHDAVWLHKVSRVLMVCDLVSPNRVLAIEWKRNRAASKRASFNVQVSMVVCSAQIWLEPVFQSSSHGRERNIQAHTFAMDLEEAHSQFGKNLV